MGVGVETQNQSSYFTPRLDLHGIRFNESLGQRIKKEHNLCVNDFFKVFLRKQIREVWEQNKTRRKDKERRKMVRGS